MTTSLSEPPSADQPPPMGVLAYGRQWVREAHRLDWSKATGSAALHAAPVPIVALIWGLLTGHALEATVTVGAAVTVGFGAFHQLTRWRVVPMVVAGVGFAVSAWVGAVVGQRDLATALATAAAWGGAFGAATALGQGAWWIGLQCVVALCISASPVYSSGVRVATERGLLVLLGGALQLAVTTLIWWARGEPFVYRTVLEPFDWGLLPCRLGVRWPMGDAGVRYTWRVAVVLAAAVLVHRTLWQAVGHWPNGYWIPMTAAIVLKTDLRTTFTRGVARLSGTVVGVALVTLGVALLRPPPAVLAGAIVAALCGAFAVQKVNYGLFAVFITAYVVCLLSMMGLPEPLVALRRTAATLVGGAMALGSFLVIKPLPLSSDVEPTDRPS